MTEPKGSSAAIRTQPLSSNEKYCVDDKISDNAYDMTNETDTSSTFSLQECMNEFRARRIRRTYSAQHRQDIKKKLNDKSVQETENYLIYQNFCNREQERKCKPCRNGFCYCFTSDSGDGGAHEGCEVLCNVQPKSTRRSKHLESLEFLNDKKKVPKSSEFTKKNCFIEENTNYRKKTIKPNSLTAICSIEESAVKDPLIRIIQELHENCVVSKVKLNKSGLHSFGKRSYAKKKHNAQQQTADNNETYKYSPTAPNLEFLSDFDSNTIKSRSKKCSNNVEKQNNFGGKLLRKRQSAIQHNYKPSYMGKPPAKPPRTSLSTFETYSSDSTSSSARKTERFLENYLENKCIFNPDIKSLKRADISQNSKELKDNDICTTATETETALQNIVPKCPSLRGAEKVINSKNILLSEKNITPLTDDITKATDFGFNEINIIDMINFDADSKSEVFHTTFCQGQPQHIPSKGITKDHKFIGWQIPPKKSLDTVDGIVHHNLASNYINKSTPVKETIISPNKNSKKGSVGGKHSWPEQIKILSPWSKITNVNNNNNVGNFCSRSKAFLTSSKTKLLDFISPKKEQRRRKSFLLHFDQNLSSDEFQTKANTMYQHNSISPPGSYHSPMQSSNILGNIQCTPLKEYKNSSSNEPAGFDFTRTVQSPTKNIFRTTQQGTEKKTYQSFSSELDQDVYVSKINLILNNIRSKLEASDQRAVRIFQETYDCTDHNSTGFGCPDNYYKEHIQKSQNLHTYARVSRDCDFFLTEPIYTEIEDDKLYLSGCSNLCNQIDIEHFGAANNPNILYTKVNKKGLHLQERMQPTSLDQIIIDSTKTKKVISNVVPLKTFHEPTASKVKFNSLVPCSTSLLLHSHSLNNFKLVEHNLSANQHRNLSNSDFSLQRSELFLEHLFNSELLLNADIGSTIIGKVQKVKQNSSRQSWDAVSDEMPSTEVDVLRKGFINSCVAASELDLSKITLPSSQYQSTPKKDSFVTKSKAVMNGSNAGVEAECCGPFSQNTMCNSVQKGLSHSLSMDEESKCESYEKSNIKNDLSKNRYTSFKKLFRKSFRKTKMFVDERRKCFSTSKNFPIYGHNTAARRQLYKNFNFELNALSACNESENIDEQIAQTVSICRQLPDLEASMEMVEAERLLLFSALRNENDQNFSPVIRRSLSLNQKAVLSFFVDEMILPVSSNIEHDIFFNFFYIVTFECGGVIKSSQSEKSANGEAVFRKNSIQVNSELDIYNLQNENNDVIKCNIFMLRLRKLSTVSFDPQQKEIEEYMASSPSTKSSSKSSILSNTSADIVSRFRLQATFTVNAKDFAPYEYAYQESNNRHRICTRVSNFFSVPLVSLTRSTNLGGEIRLKGRAEIFAPKISYHGFLNVLDPYKQHNWNRRYCTLDGIFFYVWQDKSSLNITPLMSIDLRISRHNNYPLTCSPRELCARHRSFYLILELEKTSENKSSSTVFFSADTQTNLEKWLEKLNTAMDFIAAWL